MYIDVDKPNAEIKRFSATEYGGINRALDYVLEKIIPPLQQEQPKEQNSVKWNEDERIRKHIIEILEHLSPCHFDGNEKSECIAYLERQKEQKPAEWSEKEKGILLECISVLQNSSHWLLADKLSSLRPQPQPHTVSIKDATEFGNLEYERGVKDGIQSEKSHHWRPSEKQMKALKESSVSWMNEYMENCENLKSLYNDLESL